MAELTEVVLRDAQDETLVMSISFISIGCDSRRVKIFWLNKKTVGVTSFSAAKHFCISLDVVYF